MFESVSGECISGQLVALLCPQSPTSGHYWSQDKARTGLTAVLKAPLFCLVCLVLNITV